LRISDGDRQVTGEWVDALGFAARKPLDRPFNQNVVFGDRLGDKFRLSHGIFEVVLGVRCAIVVRVRVVEFRLPSFV